MTVHAVITRPDGTDAVRRRQMLSAEECSAYRRLPPERRGDWLAARVAAKEAYRLANTPHCIVPTQIVIHHWRSGAPRLRGCAARLSIAHSAGWGAAAIAPAPVGIDLERVRPIDPDLLRHVASAEELRHLETVSHDDAQLVCLAWTAKEAVLKALGTGLGVPPRSVRIVGARGDALAARTGAELGGARDWHILIRFVSGVVAALALQRDARVRNDCAWHLPARV